MGREFTSVLLIFTYDLSEKTQNLGPKVKSNTAEIFVVKELQVLVTFSLEFL